MAAIKRLTLIALAVVVVLAAVIAVLFANPVTGTSGAKVFSSREPVDVMSLGVSNSYGSYTVSYDKAQGGYVFDDLPLEHVDIDNFISLMTYCGSFGATRQVAPDGSNKADYGLDKPQATANISYSDGKSLTLSIGASEPISKNYYVQVSDDDAVYMMASAICEKFLCPKTSYLSQLVTSKAIMTSPLSEIVNVTFSGSALEQPFTVEAAASSRQATLDALSFGAATHVVRTKGIHQLDQTYGIEILGSLLGIPATEVAGYNLTDAQLEEYGFADPYITADFTRVVTTAGDAVRERLSIVMISEDSFYATVDGSGIVYVIGRPAFADIDTPKLLLRWFLTPMIMDLSGITVQTGGKTLEFEIYSEDGEQKARLNGEQLDMTRFRRFFSLATSATSADGNYLSGVEPSGEPLLSITYVYSDAQKQADTLELYPGTLRRNYVAVNGAVEFDMAEAYLTAMQSAADAMLNGKDFSTNW